MQRPRRSTPEARLELTPLLDMMFLLLTFFIFAFVLMVRLKVTDIRLPTVSGGQAVQPAAVITVSLRSSGDLFVEGRQVTSEELVPAIKALQEQTAGAQLLIATDQDARSGELFKLMDALQAAGFQDLRFLRMPSAAQAGP